MALKLVITDAGRAEIINAQNDGTTPVLISEVGFGTGQYTADPTQTTLQSEIKRISTISGEVVADDTIHVVVQDETSDAYDVGEFGLYTDSGTLFAVYSQGSASGWIIEKNAASTLLLASDVVLETLEATSVTFGSTAFINPPASETVMGVVELANHQEALDGDDLTRAMPPKRVHEAFKQYGLGVDAAVTKDADLVTETCYFRIAPEDPANPYPSAGHSVMHIQHGNGHAFQMIFLVSSGAFIGHMVRRRYNAAWEPWEKIWQGGAQSFGSAGYQRLPSGLIFQWGSANPAGFTGTRVSFPVAFPTRAACLMVSDIIPDNIDSSGAQYAQDAFSDLTLTGAAIHGDGVVYWFAVGY